MEPTVQPRVRRPRPKVVTLSDAAAARVREIMGRAEKPYAGLRVGVKNGGCAGSEYVLEYADEAGPLDEVVEDKGVRILIETQGRPLPESALRSTTRSRASPRSSCSGTPTRPTPAGAARA